MIHVKPFYFNFGIRRFEPGLLRPIFKNLGLLGFLTRTKKPGKLGF